MNKSIVLKFSIGFIAGLCAAMLPRLIAELASGNNSDAVVLFSQNYISLSLLFAVLIGAVITILEWDDIRKPKDIFMSALAIPGVLSGALNTATSVNDFVAIEQENIAYEEIIEQRFNIPTIDLSQSTPINDPLAMHSERRIAFSLINAAYAAEPATKEVTKFGLGIRNNPQSYVVVLEQATSSAEAESKAAALLNSTPVEVYSTNRGHHFVITASEPQSKANALFEAIELNKKGFSPELLKIKQP